YGEGTSGREQDDEEGEPHGGLHHHGLLHALRLPRLRRLRQRGAREHAHRLRLLRALLAHRLRQRLHRRAPRRRLPGLLPAHLRRRGELGRGTVAGLGLRRPPVPSLRRRQVRRQHVQDGVEDGVRRREHHTCHLAALLQRHPWAPRRARVLAAHRVLPRGDVHPAEQSEEVLLEVGGAAEPELRVFRGDGGRDRRVRAGDHPVAQKLCAVQDQV
ncbi:hypothetical protein CFC21_031808, partial [Triticum aestivum]